MILKMGEIINFNYFYNEVKDKKLSFKVLYKLSNLAKVIEEKSAFYREKFQEIIKECGEFDENGNLIPTEDGNGIKVKPGTEQECIMKINELQMLDVDMPDIKFDIDDFGNIELTMEVFNLITPFLN
jgi:hypothetical protein